MSDFSEPFQAFKRNDYGLLEGVEYKFTPDKYIDWIALIDRKTGVVPNRDQFKGKTFQEINDLDTTTLSDSEVLILLGTLKKLARMRGYNYVKFTPIRVERDFVSMICEIEFIGNYETSGKPVVFQSTANASVENVKGEFQKYLETLAENRAFARCIRNFLGINIVSKEEMVATENVEVVNSPIIQTASAPIGGGTDPLTMLTAKVRELNWSFDQFHNKILEANNKNKEENKKKDEDGIRGPRRKVLEGVEDWKSYKDIPKDQLFSLTDRINKYIEELRKVK